MLSGARWVHKSRKLNDYTSKRSAVGQVVGAFYWIERVVVTTMVYTQRRLGPRSWNQLESRDDIFSGCCQRQAYISLTPLDVPIT